MTKSCVRSERMFITLSIACYSLMTHMSHVMSTKRCTITSGLPLARAAPQIMHREARRAFVFRPRWPASRCVQSGRYESGSSVVRPKRIRILRGEFPPDKDKSKKNIDLGFQRWILTTRIGRARRQSGVPCLLKPLGRPQATTP